MDIKEYVARLFEEGFYVYPKPFQYKMIREEDNKTIVVDLSNYPDVKVKQHTERCQSGRLR